LTWAQHNDIRHFKLNTLLTSAFASRLQRLSQLACECNKLLGAYFLLVILIEDMTHARDIGFLDSLDAVDGREVVRSVMFYGSSTVNHDQQFLGVTIRLTARLMR